MVRKIFWFRNVEKFALQDAAKSGHHVSAADSSGDKYFEFMLK
jgi:hypothetical protein